jgi:hypothetical protein
LATARRKQNVDATVFRSEWIEKFVHVHVHGHLYIKMNELWDAISKSVYT